MEWSDINAFGYVLTEEQAIPDATPEHIDLGAFRTYLERPGFDTVNDPQPDRGDDLRNRDVVVETGGELHATLYGILAFGKDPQRYRRGPEISERMESSASRWVARNSRSFSLPALAFDSTIWESRATGIAISSTSNIRRAGQIASKSKPLITSDRSTSVPIPSLARVSARRSTIARARSASRGSSSRSIPANNSNPLSRHTCQATSKFPVSAGRKRSRSSVVNIALPEGA